MCSSDLAEGYIDPIITVKSLEIDKQKGVEIDEFELRVKKFEAAMMLFNKAKTELNVGNSGLAIQ